MESKRWNPAHWKHEKLSRFLKHVFSHATNECAALTNPYQGNLIAAELKMQHADIVSKELLAALGIPTLGAK